MIETGVGEKFDDQLRSSLRWEFDVQPTVERSILLLESEERGLGTPRIGGGKVRAVLG